MGNIQRVDRSKPWRARYWGPDGRQHSKGFARKVDAERWLKVSEAESLTGRWVDPAAGVEPFGPYAEEWIAIKRSTVGETTATNAASLAISSGASIKAVQRMLGHASAKMTLDVYGSLFEEVHRCSFRSDSDTSKFEVVLSVGRGRGIEWAGSLPGRRTPRSPPDRR